jgi:hypothetical protein
MDDTSHHRILDFACQPARDLAAGGSAAGLLCLASLMMVLILARRFEMDSETIP